MTRDDHPSSDSRWRRAYRAYIGLAGGAAIGFLVWIVAGAMGSMRPSWPFVAAGAAVGGAITWRTNDGPRRWQRLLWIPIALVGALFFYLAMHLADCC